MQGPIPAATTLVGLLLLLLSVAVLTVVFDRGRFWWQWWRQRRGHRSPWDDVRPLGGADTGADSGAGIADWERRMAFGEPLLQAASLLAPLTGLIGTVLGLMQVLASLGPGLTLPADAPLSGYGRVLTATLTGLCISLVASASLLANQAARRWQIDTWRRRRRNRAQALTPGAAPR